MATQPYIYLQTQRWDPVSISIRYATRSEVSHAGFLLGDRFLSAQGSGVKIRPRDPHSELWILEAPGTDKAYNWAMTQLGKPYDFGAIAGIALDRNWRDQARWFCSELVAASFEAAGAPLLNPSVAVHWITPRDLGLSNAIRLVRTVGAEESL